jgi:alginate biosynthesis protein Alg44
MNTAVNANVVHESEAQRQHARVKIPAKLRFYGPDRTPVEARCSTCPPVAWPSTPASCR